MSTEHEPFVASAPTHGLNYEPDKFELKPILAVPVVVVITTVVCYLVTSAIFNGIFSPAIHSPEERPHLVAKERNDAPLNDRLARTSLNDKSKDSRIEFVQPRLEGAVIMQESRRDDGYIINAEMTTGLKKKDDSSNSPHYYPEDLRPERWEALKDIKQSMDSVLKKFTEPKLEEIPIDADANRAKESNGGAATAKPAKTEKKPEVK